MATQFEAGALDGVLSPTLRDTRRYQQDPTKFQVLLNPPAGDALMILCNCSVEPTNNKQLRQALDYALDRQRIVDTILLCLSQPMDLPDLPPSPAFDATKIGVKLNPVPTDPVALTQQLVTQKYPGLASATSLYGSLHPGLMSGNPHYNPLNNWSAFHDPTYTRAGYVDHCRGRPHQAATGLRPVA